MSAHKVSTLDGAALLGSLDRHYLRGNLWLNATQLALHRLTDSCEACASLERARQARLAINQEHWPCESPQCAELAPEQRAAIHEAAAR